MNYEYYGNINIINYELNKPDFFNSDRLFGI